MLLTLPLLPLLAAAQLAGNEDYARDSRRLLKRGLDKRWSPSPAFGPESVSFTVGDKQYLSPTGAQFQAYDLEPNWGLDGHKGQSVLVTVFHVNGEVTCDSLSKDIERYSQVDDVWDQSFMQAVVLTSKGEYHVAEDVAGCVAGWGGSLVIKSGAGTSSVKNIGLAHVNNVDVYRMYRDENQAFTSAVVHTTNGTFVDLATATPGLNTLSIPVPSRLYTVNLANPRPLEGRRVVIKDLFDMAGLRTGGGSRAYFNTYPPRQTTAKAVQRLLDQGVILVGRAKTSQFANGETPTADWVDQMAPYNPRGDGYQYPSESSSGSGAAIAAYDWIDNTIGTDTGGSIAGPAGVQGVYGMRPSWGAITLEGAIPLLNIQDSTGVFDRSAKKGSEFVKAWYGDKFKEYSQFPKTVFLPSSEFDVPSDSPLAPVYASFREGLTSLLSPTVDNRDLEGIWNDTGRVQRFGSNSSVYTADVYGTLIAHYQWNNFGRAWIEDYKAQNDGRVPFISPAPLVRWSYGRDNVTEEIYAERAERAQRKQNYLEFIRGDVLQSDNQTCSRAIYMAPQTVGAPQYRNTYKGPAQVPYGEVFVAPFSGVPQLVVPIGQVPYQSIVTNITEYLPVTVSMYAAVGCDYMLWDLAAALEEKGVLPTVKVGRTVY